MEGKGQKDEKYYKFLGAFLYTTRRCYNKIYHKNVIVFVYELFCFLVHKRYFHFLSMRLLKKKACPSACLPVYNAYCHLTFTPVLDEN